METVSLKELAARVSLTSKPGAKLDWDQQDDWKQNANGYRCTLRYKGRRYSFDFWQGIGIEHEPDAEVVLDCLLSDAHSGEQGFNEFCDEFGYDSDSRKAEKIWKACRKVRQRMQKLLGGEFETFIYADRN